VTNPEMTFQNRKRSRRIRNMNLSKTRSSRDNACFKKCRSMIAMLRTSKASRPRNALGSALEHAKGFGIVAPSPQHRRIRGVGETYRPLGQRQSSQPERSDLAPGYDLDLPSAFPSFLQWIPSRGAARGQTRIPPRHSMLATLIKRKRHVHAKRRVLWELGAIG
jgi:hypothetical protein